MSKDCAEEDLCEVNRKAFKSLSLRLLSDSIKGSCIVSVHWKRSMDSVPDLHDQINFEIYLAQVDIWGWILI